MRTRKLLISVVLCWLCVVQLADCQAERTHGRYRPAKSRGKTYRGKYDTDLSDRKIGADPDEEKRNYPVRVVGGRYTSSSRHLGREDSSMAYRVNRAIDAPG